MKLIGYKIFYSEEEFVEWQRVEERVIYVINSIILDLKGETKESKDKTETDTKMRSTIGIFVTYEYKLNQ